MLSKEENKNLLANVDYAKGEMYIEVSTNYCPMCGRKLEK